MSFQLQSEVPGVNQSFSTFFIQIQLELRPPIEDA